MGIANDYRISTIAVRCKDCGEDVGFYPARHKCEQVLHSPLPPINLPTGPTTDVRVKRTQTSKHPPPSAMSQWKINRSNSTTTADHWLSNNKRKEEEKQESIYYERFATHLPQITPSKRGLWDRVCGNDNLPPSAPTGKWGKLLDSVSERMQQQQKQQQLFLEDDDPDSDLSDWEGETHVSRVLREYYEKKRQPLPHWLRDDSATPPTPIAPFMESISPQSRYSYNKMPPVPAMRRPSRRKLWEEQSDMAKSRYRHQQQQHAPVVKEHHGPEGDRRDSRVGDYHHYLKQERPITRSKSHHSSSRRAIYY